MHLKVLCGFLLLPILTIVSSNLHAGEDWKPYFYDYSQAWDSMSRSERLYYIKGFFEGASVGKNCLYLCMYRMKKDSRFGFLIKLPDVSEEQECAAPFVIKEEIIERITELYNDIANAGISIETMVFIARDRARGKSINDKLIEAREKVVEYSKSIEMGPGGVIRSKPRKSK